MVDTYPPPPPSFKFHHMVVVHYETPTQRRGREKKATGFPRGFVDCDDLALVD